MSVAVALAECQHHTAQRQKTARAGREEQVALHGHGPEQLPSQPELFQLFEEEPCGSRPPCLSEPRGPQEKVQQRSVDQIADYALMVQILDTSKPHMVDQLEAVLTQVDSFVPEQVIAVPKISSPPRCSRTVLGEPQTKQLVEAPTLVSIVAVFKHIVDTPVGARWSWQWRSSRFSPRTEFSDCRADR